MASFFGAGATASTTATVSDSNEATTVESALKEQEPEYRGNITAFAGFANRATANTNAICKTLEILKSILSCATVMQFSTGQKYEIKRSIS